MKKKIYLEPKASFDPCIIQESEEVCIYSVQMLLEVLIKQFAFGDSDTTDQDFYIQAVEWFEYNIEPLQGYYNIGFKFEDNS